MQINQQWQLLKLIPAFPNKISASHLQTKLTELGGREYSLRTIQRELHALARTFELGLDTKQKPYGWYWQEGVNLIGAGQSATDLPIIDIGLSSLSEKVLFEAYFYQDLKNTLRLTPLSKDQKITRFDDDWFKLSATVEVNQTFIQWLLSCGDRVELIAPTNLREWITQMLNNTQAYYL